MIEGAYTHPKGKGAGKFNGMAKAGDWENKRVYALRPIRNRGGKAVTPGMAGTVTGAYAGLNVTFDICEHCGTKTHISRVNYDAVGLEQPEPGRLSESPARLREAIAVYCRERVDIFFTTDDEAIEWFTKTYQSEGWE